MDCTGHVFSPSSLLSRPATTVQMLDSRLVDLIWIAMRRRFDSEGDIKKKPTEITSIHINMDFDINLYQAAIKSTKHANFNMYLHDEDSVDVNMISFCLFHSLNFSSRLLSQKKMDFYAAKSPILSAIQSSSGQVAIESVAWHSWPSFGRIISRNFTKPLANPTWGTVSFLKLHWARYRPRLCTLEGSCAQLSCVQSCRICSNFWSEEFLRP